MIAQTILIDLTCKCLRQDIPRDYCLEGGLVERLVKVLQTAQSAPLKAVTCKVCRVVERCTKPPVVLYAVFGVSGCAHRWQRQVCRCWSCRALSATRRCVHLNGLLQLICFCCVVLLCFAGHPEPAVRAQATGAVMAFAIALSGKLKAIASNAVVILVRSEASPHAGVDLIVF